jgi:hypothetical protein
MSALGRLIDLVPPPHNDRLQVDWATVEAAVQTSLPADYKQLAEIYGSGTFAGFIHVFEPVTPFLTVELAYQLRRKEEILHYLREAGREVIPYRAGELQAIAGTDNGDTLYWVRVPFDDPDACAIVANEARGTDWPTFEGGLVEFLVAVLSREIKFKIFPRDFPGRRPPRFVPTGPINP